MATISFAQTKSVTLSQVLEDLRNGMTKWKKDDIGFGSVEKKYNLLLNEAIELFNHPVIKNVEHTIPTFVIVDDITETKTKTTEQKAVSQVVETRTEVLSPVDVLDQIHPTPKPEPKPVEYKLAVEPVKPQVQAKVNIQPAF